VRGGSVSDRERRLYEMVTQPASGGGAPEQSLVQRVRQCEHAAAWYTAEGCGIGESETYRLEQDGALRPPPSD
jgi:hypothetical protein